MGDKLYGNRYDKNEKGKNRWLELDKYMRNAIIRGCTDEEQLKKVALRHAGYLFGDDGFITNKGLEKEIKAFISSFIHQIKNEVRNGGEAYENIDLKVARVRMIQTRMGDKIYK